MMTNPARVRAARNSAQLTTPNRSIYPRRSVANGTPAPILSTVFSVMYCSTDMDASFLSLLELARHIGHLYQWPIRGCFFKFSK